MSDFELTAPVDIQTARDSRRYSSQRENMKVLHADGFQTPPEAILPLLPYIPEWATVIDPACGKGNIVRAFCSHGYRASGSDINKGKDFLQKVVTYSTDYIVTNPPYSIKDAWIEHCYELGSPFALLMPLTALEGQRRQACYKKYGLQVMILPKRISFETPNDKGSSSWFATAWYCWKLNLPSDLYFSNVEPPS
jgi:hypothetical protein